MITRQQLKDFFLKEQVEKITEVKGYTHYYHVPSSSKIDIFFDKKDSNKVNAIFLSFFDKNFSICDRTIKVTTLNALQSKLNELSNNK